MKLFAAALFVSLGVVAQANLENASFEDPDISDQTYSFGSIPGWSSNSSDHGVWNIPYSGAFSIEAPDGTQIGYVNYGSLTQMSTDRLQVGTTTLSAMAGRRNDDISSSFNLQLWAGGTVSDGDVVGGILLSQIFVDIESIPRDSFSLVSLSYTALAGDANLGRRLSVRFEQTGTIGWQANVDDVRLMSAPVPEPGTMLALGLGASAFLRRRFTR